MYFLERSGGGSAGLGFNTIAPPFNDIPIAGGDITVDRPSVVD